MFCEKITEVLRFKLNIIHTVYYSNCNITSCHRYERECVTVLVFNGWWFFRCRFSKWLHNLVFISEDINAEEKRLVYFVNYWEI